MTYIINENKLYELNKDVYKEFIKCLFCPKSIKWDTTFSEVQQLTMQQKSKRGEVNDSLISLRKANLWLPPESALERMADLINMQIEYLETAGVGDAKLPNFLGKDCLRKTDSGDIEYYFGPDAKRSMKELTRISKRQLDDTPQKGRRRKRQVTSTPSKLRNTSNQS